MIAFDPTKVVLKKVKHPVKQNFPLKNPESDLVAPPLPKMIKRKIPQKDVAPVKKPGENTETN